MARGGEAARTGSMTREDDGKAKDDDVRSQQPMFQSSYARRETENNLASSINNQRERIGTGRVENLRTMGSELMRPSSREGGVARTTQSAIGRDSKEGLGSNVGQTHAMANSGSGFYDPSKFNRYGAADENE